MALVKSINRNGEILTPHIADDVFMAENATVVGDVTVGAKVLMLRDMIYLDLK